MPGNKSSRSAKGSFESGKAPRKPGARGRFVVLILGLVLEFPIFDYDYKDEDDSDSARNCGLMKILLSYFRVAKDKNLPPLDFGDETGVGWKKCEELFVSERDVVCRRDGLDCGGLA